MLDAAANDELAAAVADAEKWDNDAVADKLRQFSEGFLAGNLLPANESYIVVLRHHHLPRR